MKHIEIVDLPGHFNYRQKLRDYYLPQAAGIILVVDSKDKQKISEAAEYLFDVISDVDIATSGVPLIVACNKSDLSFARRAVQIERDLQIEIE